MPIPPTSFLEDEPIDGRKRAERRRRLAKTRKIPFHQREAVSVPDEQSQPSSVTVKGHTLFRKHEPIHNWGEIPCGASKSENDTSATV
jgi:hypothetical protein